MVAMEAGSKVSPGKDDAALFRELRDLLGSADIESNDPRFGAYIQSLRTETSSLKQAHESLRGGTFASEPGVNPWTALRSPLSELRARLDRLQRASIEEDLHGVALAVSSSARGGGTCQ